MKEKKPAPIFGVLDTLAPVGMAQVKAQDGTLADKPVYDSDEVKRALLARFQANRQARGE